MARLLASVVGTELADGEIKKAHDLLLSSNLPCEGTYTKSYDPERNDPVELCSLFGLDCMMREIKRDLSELGVEFDNWVSERDFYKKGEVQEALKELEKMGYLYQKEGALWVKTSSFGDDKDRVIRKSDGSFTYFASDIAYHLNKHRRGFDRVINLWGSDHHGYIKRIKAALTMFSIPQDWLEVYLVQMVKMFKEGREIKMSKRAGTFVSLRELLEEVGSDAVRFVFLTRRSDTPLDFNVDLVKEKSSDNPVFYVQYAHARIAGVFRELKKRYGKEASEVSSGADLGYLKAEQEMELVKKVLMLKDELISALEGRDPHIITYYLIELASSFHNYYNHNRVIGSGEGIMEARIALLNGVRTAVALGLKLIGVSAPERM
jgi:arginyl-tRNA synthetase